MMMPTQINTLNIANAENFPRVDWKATNSISFKLLVRFDDRFHVSEEPEVDTRQLLDFSRSTQWKRRIMKTVI